MTAIDSTNGRRKNASKRLESAKDRPKSTRASTRAPASEDTTARSGIAQRPSKTIATRPMAALGRSAKRCRACPLWKPATQTVFGEGPDDARIVVVGEQAGDREDLDGHPFVGPSGRLLDDALAECGVDRKALYITNVIKHFKFEMRGKRRLHKRANAAEIDACLRWLDAEIVAIAPRYIVCLGAMAARVVFGARFRLMKERGEWRRIGASRWALATVHPSAVLRAGISGTYDDARAAFVADLAKLRKLPRTTAAAE